MFTNTPAVLIAAFHLSLMRTKLIISSLPRSRLADPWGLTGTCSRGVLLGRSWSCCGDCRTVDLWLW